MRALKSRPGLLNYVVLLIFAIPLAALATGVGAFLGMTVAVAGWGPAFLNEGALVGVSVSLVLLLIWVIVFVVRAREPPTGTITHVEKVTLFVEEMKGRGVAPGVAAPALFRLWWNLGFQAPPPLFLGVWVNFAWSFALMATLLVSAAAIYWWKHPHVSLWNIWLTVLLFLPVLAVLVVYGAVAANRTARKYQLPPWEDFRPAPPPAKASSAG